MSNIASINKSLASINVNLQVVLNRKVDEHAAAVVAVMAWMVAKGYTATPYLNSWRVSTLDPRLNQYIVNAATGQIMTLPAAQATREEAQAQTFHQTAQVVQLMVSARQIPKGETMDIVIGTATADYAAQLFEMLMNR